MHVSRCSHIFEVKVAGIFAMGLEDDLLRSGDGEAIVEGGGGCSCVTQRESTREVKKREEGIWGSAQVGRA